METQTEKQDVVAALRQEASKNEPFGAIMYVLAHRERTRTKLDLLALQRTMEQHGADFKRDVYEHCIQFLAKQGLGEVVKSARGKIIGLKNINTTLQSIGQAASGKLDKVEAFRPAKLNKFKKLPFITKDQAAFPAREKLKNYTVGLKVIINHGPINFTLPTMDAEDLGEFIMNITSLVNSYKGKQSSV